MSREQPDTIKNDLRKFAERKAEVEHNKDPTGI